jgi:hypothetical protein
MHARRPLLVISGLACFAGTIGSAAAESCDPPLARSIQATKAAWSSRAVDTAAITDTATRDWIPSELRLIDEACTRGKDVEAAWRLEQIQKRLTVAMKTSPVRSRCQTRLRFANSCSLLAVANTGRRTMNVEPTPSTLSAATSP